MALILAAVYLLQGSFNADASPLSVVLPRQTSTDLGAPEDCLCPDTRSQWDIVQSCLATIFICTWVSVHPNIPPLGEPQWKKVFRRLELMFWSIIAPELIIFWAAKQWTAARQLVTTYKEYKWTMSHGYFIQMGGFMLYDNDKPKEVLEPKKLYILAKLGRVVMPQIREEEIQDRSKSDGLSKALVVIQTTWFIGQCIARRAQGLITTELELATLAFAAVNGVMYLFWWFKPLDVQTTVRVDLCPPRFRNAPVDPAVVEADYQTDISHIQQEFPSSELELPPTPGSITELGRNNVTGGLIETSIEHENLIPFSKMRLYQRMKNSKFQDICSSVWWLISGILFRWPVNGISASVTRVGSIINSDPVDDGAMGVPMFNVSGMPTEIEGWEGLPVVIAIPFVSILFGAIHCAGWHFRFPSLIEAKIWRVSSSIITSIPVIVPVLGIRAGFLFDILIIPKLLDPLFQGLQLPMLTGIIILVSIPLYIVARLALLVVALTTLRDLPPGALAAVEWTSFLPHI